MRVMNAGLIGLGISIICLIPPIIHLLTGPLAPFIGGVVAGTRAKANASTAVTLGFIMAVGLGIIVGFGACTAAVFMSGSSNPLSPALVVGIEIGVLLYTFVLGSIGATIGGRMAR